MVVSTESGNSARPAGASVVVLKADSVLMVLRSRAPMHDLWSFPGGRAEADENAEATARRELFEETGLSVGRLIPLGSFTPAPDLSPLRLTVFAARAADGEPRAGDDAAAAEFVALETVLALPRTPAAPGWIARAIVALSDAAVS